MIRYILRPALISFLIHVVLFAVVYYAWTELARGSWLFGEVWDRLARVTQDSGLLGRLLEQRLQPVQSALALSFLIMAGVSLIATFLWFWRAKAARVAGRQGMLRLRGVWIASVFVMIPFAALAGAVVAYFRMLHGVLAVAPLVVHGGGATMLILIFYWLASVVATPRAFSLAVPMAPEFWALFHRKPRS